MIDTKTELSFYMTGSISSGLNAGLNDDVSGKTSDSFSYKRDEQIKL